jgi:hypothetical protein
MCACMKEMCRRIWPSTMYVDLCKFMPNASSVSCVLSTGGVTVHKFSKQGWTVSTVGASDPKVPSQYRLESTTFTSAPKHPYAVKVQDGPAANSTRTVVAASTGSSYAQFQLFDASSVGGFYLYNAASQTFLSQKPSAAHLPDDVEAESAISFASATGEDIRRFIWQFFLDEDMPNHGMFIINQWNCPQFMLSCNVPSFSISSLRDLS